MGRAGWLADAARRWGLAVVECDGWQTRGSTDFGPGGTVAHHTAGPGGGGDIPSLPTLIGGRPDLAGPLCNYGLGRSGTVYVVAAGRANHAGSGGWRGLSGNSSVVGIEAENDGYQPWPAEQTAAYQRLCAAVCEHLGIPADYVCRHHEWRAEKPDPHDVDGDTGRAAIGRLLAGGPAPAPTKPKAGGGPMWNPAVPGRADDVWLSPDGHVLHQFYDPAGGRWSPTEQLGTDANVIAGDLLAAWRPDGAQLRVVGTGVDGQRWEDVYDTPSGRWSGWHRVGT